ncbi:conserved hypothetical protein [Clostridium neonatale]|nr:transcriptional regulator [Clostridium neonatale]CAI3226592.1 conserved hypothetical protein [Clostridium neonatale]
MKEESVYRKARKQAVIYNGRFKSMEGASEFLCVSKDMLLNYESGLNPVPVDMVCKMADIYNAPELLNHYCCNECPIGKRTVSPISKENINNIYKLSINIFQLLGQGTNMGKTLLNVVEDGIISDDEKPQIDYIVNNLKRLSGLTTDLIIALEKTDTE